MSAIVPARILTASTLLHYNTDRDGTICLRYSYDAPGSSDSRLRYHVVRWKLSTRDESPLVRIKSAEVHREAPGEVFDLGLTLHGFKSNVRSRRFAQFFNGPRPYEFVHHIYGEPDQWHVIPRSPLTSGGRHLLFYILAAGACTLQVEITVASLDDDPSLPEDNGPEDSSSSEDGSSSSTEGRT
ncbi:hypothetical protein CPB83DRAFT_899626 [Crepidotus variabilis]|uniref:Uncharacterized protein n=1 Tax=Crepidotus variabilis TaxID=179855 RepID=A0A9P6E4U5_9AGAR|nr:hypothetical protein CPB83DRAFT_899626 [Crepidotus variabilis]